ncbi:MAG: hypothetical protein IKP74_07395, partial [Clostridia bacterium]|nr:hypothetical protein [Clostridia bacterium]
LSAAAISDCHLLSLRFRLYSKTLTRRKISTWKKDLKNFFEKQKARQEQDKSYLDGFIKKPTDRLIPCWITYLPEAY